MIRRALTALAYLLVLLVAFGVVGPLRQAAMASPLLVDLIGAPAPVDETGVELRIHGRLPPLFPGFHGTFAAQVTNPAYAAGPVQVVSIAVEIGDGSAKCPARNLSIGSYSRTSTARTYTIPPGSTVSVPMSITMSANGADACQGATFPVRYSMTSQPI